jgi:hypothetical protein
MANLLAIHSVGASLVTYLRNAYPNDLQTAHPCDFRLLSSGELASKPDFSTTLSLYLYRVTMNEHLRNQRRRAGPGDDMVPLALDLHYLLTIWADSALAEHSILAWAVRQLYMHETLSTSDLSPDAGWGPSDVVQVIPAELSNEDLMRIWDTLDPPYRLSVSYIARVVRIDPDAVAPALPAVARRLQFTEQVVE